MICFEQHIIIEHSLSWADRQALCIPFNEKTVGASPRIFLKKNISQNDVFNFWLLNF